MNAVSTSYIEVQNLSRDYAQGETIVHALSGINLGFNRGEFGALVGPSGSGKSTLLNCMGALDKPSQGTVLIDGKDVTALTGNKLSDFRLQNIGFVFQAYNLVPVLTAYENVEYILLLQGVDAQRRRERILKLADRMDMQDLMHRFPDQLSGGQQQRVAVARALIGEPEVVLADEPTANLDTHNAEKLIELMLQMCEETSTTFLFSTHDERVIKSARRLIHLRDGQIEQDEKRS
ncbi:MAG TPA: macrolide ABC transporter ATP-binding protein [Leptospiraceae bacterium]|nr:macrolide ABC transporter ATP-binding protein [Spirochaetaceae bacterium]HBS06042.1 macrolide ABC transporter ATP-binding protein [Leptospiraceae bacterium]|tara:strand:- start:232571 stop:233272 length:702 start_codon:yes stop_codon:yes gene_type:complete